MKTKNLWLRSFLFRTAILLLLCLAGSVYLLADTISGTVKDPSGAVIVGAQIEITGGELAKPLVLTSDGAGKFMSPDLKPGKYSVRVTRDGFEPSVNAIDLHGTTDLRFTLTIARQQTSISVSEKSLAFANSDPVYRQLREIGFGESFRCEDFTLPWDVATFQFKRGTFTLLKSVNGMVTGVVFVGQGHFNLKAIDPFNARELSRRTGKTDADDDFTEVIFRFTDDAWQKFSAGTAGSTGTPPEAAAAFQHWKEKMRRRNDSATSFTESILEGDDMDNVDADALAAIYDPTHPPFFNAYIRGVTHKDLRFFVRTRVGAIPQIDSPEEVGLINFSPEAMDDGIWYLAHLKSELLNHTASSQEDRRLFATRRYKIETVIGKNEHLYGIASITFEPLLAGERLLKFELLPNLRVARVRDEQGQNLHFIQENRKDDGSFYVILDKAIEVGKEHTITVEYAGDKVIRNAGDGSFYIIVRESWYPNLNGFKEKALYDLTYKVPRKYKVISVGKLQGESTEQDFAVTHWITPEPVAVAGFNYGDYKRMDLPDDKDSYKISGYYLTELPDSLLPFRQGALESMSPMSMTKYVLEQARAQLQVCSFYFGKSPYDEIYITEQPDFNFGQSWPNLVYLPISAYIDSTQRWMLFGSIQSGFTGFVQEVTPHEVAHQWWGHAVTWASYHDLWLSEGFAEFSAGLFLQQAMAGDWKKDYVDFWERLRKRVLEKNTFGVAPNDAGPLWMGSRLISPRSENAYRNVTYPKGAYVLEMLRSIMYSNQDHDAAFIAMMHDFVESHRERPASTESFKAIAEKHITKSMDLQGNGSLDWFFNEWVYGTQIPRYQFKYDLSPADGGKTKLHMELTQSEVDNTFAMQVPVFADFGKGMVRIGEISIGGNSTRSVDALLPAQPKKVALNALKEILER